MITNKWYKKIRHTGQASPNTDDATIDVIKNAAREIYQEYPEILEALGL